MAQYQNSYPTVEVYDAFSRKYIFISTGINVIIKAVEFQCIEPSQEEQLFNLAFGDFDLATGQFNDLVDSNNGDHYAVLNTVLSTIPAFFERNPNATMMVQGSDSKQEYVDICKITCRKKCGDKCKNTERRISAYRYYVDKNYIALNKKYQFLGGATQFDGTILKEEYVKGKAYDTVFCKKRITLRNEN